MMRPFPPDLLPPPPPLTVALSITFAPVTTITTTTATISVKLLLQTIAIGGHWRRRQKRPRSPSVKRRCMSCLREFQKFFLKTGSTIEIILSGRKDGGGGELIGQ
ncbi:hypothetical protein TYRP_003938 [Tyrophagus putrescentiae]|nr:hypothetical protein TYRP_003938 [Tyrophagus putrescentiae]